MFRWDSVRVSEDWRCQRTSVQCPGEDEGARRSLLWQRSGEGIALWSRANHIIVVNSRPDDTDVSLWSWCPKFSSGKAKWRTELFLMTVIIGLNFFPMVKIRSYCYGFKYMHVVCTYVSQPCLRPVKYLIELKQTYWLSLRLLVQSSLQLTEGVSCI